MENEDNWAQPENPEVEQAKDAYAEAQQAEVLRNKISVQAAKAVNYGHVDRDWVNIRLARMGADLVTGKARYKINAPIVGAYGATVIASSRTEALTKFKTYLDKVLADGEVRPNEYGHGVFAVTATGADPAFFSGPQDIETSDKVPSLDALKTLIRQMLKDGVTGQGWGLVHAAVALADMGLEPLPTLHMKQVTVPVSGSTQLTVPVFEGDDDAAVQAATVAIMGRGGPVSVNPEEMGAAIWPRPESSATTGFTLVDDEEGEDEAPDDGPY